MLHELNVVDYGIIAIMTISVIFGLFRGFAREAVSLLTWIAAISLAIFYSEQVGALFPSVSAEGARLIIGGVLIILGVLILGGIINFLIGKLISNTKFNLPDRFMGGLFGIARGLFAVSIAILVSSPTILSEKDFWKKSLLIPHFSPAARWIKERFPDDIIKDYLEPFVNKGDHDLSTQKLPKRESSIPKSKSSTQILENGYEL